MKRFLALTLAMAALVASSAAVAQCDLPLMVQSGAVPPNVMIIMDDSGSMREVIYHEAYDASISWPGPFEELKAYSVSEDGEYTPASWDNSFAGGPSVNLVASEKGKNGRYLGNYLNWLFFHATDKQRSEQPQTTRIEVGKAALHAIMAQSPGLRYGLMSFNGDSGGEMVSRIGLSGVTALATEVDDLTAGGYTPSAETLLDALEYFQEDGADAPIQYQCQQNFVVFITDGYPTKDRDIPAWIGDQDGDGNEPGDCESIEAPEPNSADCSDYLDDVAYYMAHNDLRDDLDGDQFVNTYTIGFGLDAKLLVETAENGNGEYFYAWNLESLTAGLGAVVGDIVARVSAGSAVAVVSTEQESEGYLYRSKFLPAQWRGYLEAFELPYQDGEPAVWEAGQLLSQRDPDDRWIFTHQYGQQVSFQTSKADLLREALGAQDEDEARDIIDFVRGEDVDGMRDRNGWKLGDIVHSSPLLVGRPADFILDEDFQIYLHDNLNRTPVVYVGANDGMLHAFDAASGTEMWSYIPESVLGSLVDLTRPDYCHTAYVDLTPTAYEVEIAGSWRTVLVGGLRAGGDAYFALDVTVPYSPKVLWETSIPELTSSFAQPTLVRHATGTYLWLGSGPDPGGDAVAAVLNLATGMVEAVSSPLSQGLSTNLTTVASVYDADWNGTTDYVYQGDLEGNLWRWDVRGPMPWTAQRVFSSDQPIQARPTLSLAPDGDLLVYFGTGRYLESADLDDTDPQRFYCVRDDMATVDLTPASLVDQTGSIHDLEGADGWYVDLEQMAGERIVEPAKIVEGVVYATSFAPQTGECSSGGRSWLYRFAYLDGDHPKEKSLDDRVVDLGEGIASRPVVHLDTAEVLVQTSDARLNIEAMSIQPRRIVVQSWTPKMENTYNEEGNQ